MRAASVFYHGMFNSAEFTLPENWITKNNIPLDDRVQELVTTFIEKNDLVCSEISFRGQDYSSGDLVVLKVEDCDELLVGLIQTIVVKGDVVYFGCKSYICRRQWLQYFESLRLDKALTFVKGSDLADYKPLVLRGSSARFVFVLHHRVSFLYT